MAEEITGAVGETGHVNWILARLGTAIVLSMAVMVFTLPMYTGELFEGADENGSPLALQWMGILRYASLALTLPVFIILGLPILANALDQLRLVIITTDVLIVIGVAAAFVYSCASTILDRGDTYFETVCMVLVLVTVGRYLETKGKVGASNAIMSMESLLPDEVDMTRQTERRRVKTTELQVGDQVHVPAGQSCPVDGVIVSGTGHVDEQIVTGESTPLLMKAGDAVRAGATLLDAALSVRATAVGALSTVGRMTKLLEEAKASKGRFERLADRVAALFIPLVVVLASIACVWGAGEGGLSSAIPRGLAVLLISCPCALGIATPMATWIGMGRSARRGVLFRSSQAMEALAGVRAVAFDKTGTLTTGVASVSSFDASEHHRDGSITAIALAAGVSETSQHVLAQGIVEFAQTANISPQTVSNVQVVPGRGALARMNGDAIRVGSLLMLEEAKIHIDSGLREKGTRHMTDGSSVAWVARDDEAIGVFAFTERLRDDVLPATSSIVSIGCVVEILTGDHQARGTAVQKALNIPTVSELTPQGKVTEVKQLQRKNGCVAMVGDGLNDAPALAAADVGIAMGCGADISRESADVCLLGNDLNTIPWAMKLARATRRTVVGNLFWAFAYNAACIPLAMMGKLNPVMSALAMVLSSLFVVMNSRRLHRVVIDD